MAESPPGALIEKYRALATELNDVRNRLRIGEQRLAHLRTAIQLFDPHFKFSAIPVKRVPTAREEMSPNTRIMWDILRTAKEPVSAHGIAKEVLALSGAAHVDSYAVERMAARAYAFLARQEKRHTVRLVARDPKRWEIVG
ncbi:MAG TPA: hypothetical protein VGG27_02250 [Magnetospirillaceae bacterium]|jgi:hypothetical protein